MKPPLISIYQTVDKHEVKKKYFPNFPQIMLLVNTLRVLMNIAFLPIFKVQGNFFNFGLANQVLEIACIDHLTACTSNSRWIRMQSLLV